MAAKMADMTGFSSCEVLIYIPDLLSGTISNVYQIAGEY